MQFIKFWCLQIHAYHVLLLSAYYKAHMGQKYLKKWNEQALLYHKKFLKNSPYLCANSTEKWKTWFLSIFDN